MNEQQRKRFETRLARRLGRAGQDHLKRVLDALGDPPNYDNLPPNLIDELGEESRSAIQVTLEEVFVTQVQNTAQQIGIGIDWGLVNERAAQWAREHSLETIQGINATTRRGLQQQVALFFRDQRTLEDLSNSVSRLFGPQRADSIAVTEITRASSAGEGLYQAELDQLGVEYEDIWLTSRDDDVCPICGPRHQKKRGSNWAEPPPAHVKCRCQRSTRVRRNGR